jgi:hypothetical protein
MGCINTAHNFLCTSIPIFAYEEKINCLPLKNVEKHLVRDRLKGNFTD